MKIHMWDVGRSKWSGIIETERVEPAYAVVHEAKKHLMSKGVDAMDPDDGHPGLIFAGVQCVGKWEFVKAVSGQPV